ncbi:MAG: isochorismatase family protein [Myxococcota bacterium]
MIHRFTREQGALLVIDLQERLAAAMPQDKLARVINRSRAAIEGAKALGLPIAITEQYPKGLGPTLKEIAEVLPGASPLAKVEFSAFLPPIREQLSGRANILVVGMEAHVCVFQTARAIKEAGFTPYVAVDGVLSRNDADYRAGLELCRELGAQLTTVETALLDAVGRAGSPEFKAISAAIK